MKQIRIAGKTERNQTVSRHLFQVSQISLYFSFFLKPYKALKMFGGHIARETRAGAPWDVRNFWPCRNVEP